MDSVRSVIVTGASTGIGRAVALAFGKLGWKVALGARRPELLAAAAAEVEEIGGVVFAHRLDVADAESIHDFLVAAEQALGPVDVLVNNAGMSFAGMLHERVVSDLDMEVRTNLLGPMLMCREVIASLLRRGLHGGATGDLVFVSSDASRLARPLQTPYCATKAGLESFCASLALELEGTGIRCITVRPGAVLTDFAREWDFTRFDEVLRTWQRVGLQRHLETLDPGDVANAVVYAVTSPPDVHIATVEVQPLAPLTVRTEKP